MDPTSPVVCEIPDCATTKSEIDAELRSFLCGFCSICKRDRAGQLCGCAFPCSLTFRAKMMHKIYQLLAIDRPVDRRAIQVCFKHPDLIKQAREACVSRKDVHRRSGANLYNKQQTVRTQNDDSVIKESGNVAKGSENKAEGRELISEEEMPESSQIRFDTVDEDVSDLEEAESSYRSSRKGDTTEDSDLSDWESNSVTSPINPKSSNALKIVYDDYDSKVLQVEMRDLISEEHLHDVLFICKEGRRICGSSLLLASTSQFLSHLLKEIPLVDHMKTLILPDVDADTLELFFILLFRKPNVFTLTDKQIKRLQGLCRIFGIASLSMKMKTTPLADKTDNETKKLPTNLKKSKPTRKVVVEQSIEDSDFEGVGFQEPTSLQESTSIPGFASNPLHERKRKAHDEPEDDYLAKEPKQQKNLGNNLY